MFVLRQLEEKRLEVQGELALGFVDLEEVYDTVPRGIATATLRWLGLSEADVHPFHQPNKGTKGRVLIGPRI